MKKFYYLLASMAFVLVVIMACEKSAIGVDEIQTVKDDVLLSKGEKVTICHWNESDMVWENITISTSALDKHMENHSDHYPFTDGGNIYPISYTTGVYFQDPDEGNGGKHFMKITFDYSDVGVGEFAGVGHYFGGTYKSQSTLPNDLPSKVSGTIVGNHFTGTYKYDEPNDTWGEWGFCGVLDDCGNIIEITHNHDCGIFEGPLAPPVEEICDGIDNDWDGFIDEGLTFTTYYLDADGDTYGDATDVGESLCADPLDGRVTNNTDCDDTAAEVNPGAVEICGDGIDNNCDGTSSDWSIIDDWTIDFDFGSSYVHSMTITDNTFTGTGYYVTDPNYTWTVTGTITNSDITMTITYTGMNAGYTIDMTGTIASNGSMSGNALDSSSQNATWTTTTGTATCN